MGDNSGVVLPTGEVSPREHSEFLMVESVCRHAALARPTPAIPQSKHLTFTMNHIVSIHWNHVAKNTLVRQSGAHLPGPVPKTAFPGNVQGVHNAESLSEPFPAQPLSSFFTSLGMPSPGRPNLSSLSSGGALDITLSTFPALKVCILPV